MMSVSVFEFQLFSKGESARFSFICAKEVSEKIYVTKLFTFFIIFKFKIRFVKIARVIFVVYVMTQR